MARAFLSKFRAACCAIGLALAPHSALAEMMDIDLSKLRIALGAIEADVKAGFQTPADVSAYWDSLSLQGANPVDPAELNTPFVPLIAPALAPTTAPVPAMPTQFGTSFLGTARAGAVGTDGTATAARTEANTNTKPSSGGGLFALQRSQAASAALAPLPDPVIAPQITPQPVPALGAFNGSGVVTGGAKTETKTSPTAQTVPQDVDTTNFRLMLATLSQTYTGQNATAVVNAQGPRGPVAVSVRAGVVGLADIRSYATALGFAPLADGTLTVPVVIWPGATLRLSVGERMALSRDAGAFILAMGTLDINGATIEVSGVENPHTPSFVPFVTVANGGTLLMKNARLRGLGFGQTAKFSGLSVAGNLLTQSSGKVVIQDSLFDGLKSVTLAGVTGAVVSGNSFINSQNNTLSLLNAPSTVIENNIFTGGSHTNTIRLDNGSSKTSISRNIFMSGQRVAMLITGRSDHVKVMDNLIWKRDGAGVKFLNTRCGVARGNVIVDNRQKGVEVRKSNGTVVAGNLIAGNRSAGIWVSAQKPDARTALRANVFVANGSGIAAATGAEIFMDGNNFTRQLPRLLDGDISRLSRAVVADLRGQTSLRIKDGVVEQGADRTKLCGGVL